MSSLDEAFAQANEQLNNVEEATSESEETTETTVEESSNEEEVVETPTEEPVKEKSDEESFTGLNPEELPEELKPLYKSLQADYTRKRQAESKRLKDLETKLEELSKANQPKEDQKPKTPEELIDKAVESKLSEKEVLNFREEALRFYELADERLNQNSDSYDEETDLVIGQKMDKALSEYVKENGTELGFNYKKALKDSISAWDSKLQSINKRYLEQQQAKAKEKAKTVAKQNPKSSQGMSKPQKPTLDEAISLALNK